MHKIIYLYPQFLGHHNGIFDEYTRPYKEILVGSNMVVVRDLEFHH